jgi:hypothetical protein
VVQTPGIIFLPPAGLEPFSAGRGASGKEILEKNFGKALEEDDPLAPETRDFSRRKFLKTTYLNFFI